MSTYVLMKILESAPSRYDLGIRILSFGKLGEIYDRLVSRIQTGDRVLDIGCGTGAMTLRAAKFGAHVKGIDINPEMLTIAQNRTAEAALSEYIELQEKGIAELDAEISESFDVVMSGLCFSELSDDEVAFTIREINRLLKLGGLLLVADEVLTDLLWKRILHGIIRFPLVCFTYLLTQTTTHRIKHLSEKIKRSGLQITSLRFHRMGNFIELVAKKPEERE